MCIVSTRAEVVASKSWHSPCWQTKGYTGCGYTESRVLKTTPWKRLQNHNCWCTSQDNDMDTACLLLDCFKDGYCRYIHKQSQSFSKMATYFRTRPSVWQIFENVWTDRWPSGNRSPRKTFARRNPNTKGQSEIQLSRVLPVGPQQETLAQLELCDM